MRENINIPSPSKHHDLWPYQIKIQTSCKEQNIFLNKIEQYLPCKVCNKTPKSSSSEIQQIFIISINQVRKWRK